MANGDLAPREERYKRELERREQERKERAPTVGGSLKEGAKQALRKLLPRSEARPETPTEGMGGYSGRGDAKRKKYIESQTD